MEIHYIAKGIEITDTIKNFAEKKLQKISRLDQITDITITLIKEKYRIAADLMIHTKNNTWNVKEESNDVKISIQQAVAKLQKQMKRQRDKMVDRKRRAKSDLAFWPVSVLSYGQEETIPKILEENKFEIKIMSLDAAFDLLQALKNDFIIFRDDENNKVSILYKRKDGNFGLITPESD
ncbi:MAG: ribosomal subunit interface protein [Candidatus Fischerbacteria bacterium RBG_13_37_8]|uniref:Ribosomal subunit interface protein n=1 Tax=Candidatus Fischerbacteria bacterium RBG_13_37_8 TaxID=1817863 RepID=A0A1F5VRU6_9BACT|nr:MAG: ribosomal subunit interface protein [Candidatus Fischerbacteria bacterium RBG_13_37_8]